MDRFELRRTNPEVYLLRHTYSYVSELSLGRKSYVDDVQWPLVVSAKANVAMGEDLMVHKPAVKADISTLPGV